MDYNDFYSLSFDAIGNTNENIRNGGRMVETPHGIYLINNKKQLMKIDSNRKLIYVANLNIANLDNCSLNYCIVTNMLYYIGVGLYDKISVRCIDLNGQRDVVVFRSGSSSCLIQSIGIKAGMLYAYVKCDNREEYVGQLNLITKAYKTVISSSEHYYYDISKDKKINVRNAHIRSKVIVSSDGIFFDVVTPYNDQVINIENSQMIRFNQLNILEYFIINNRFLTLKGHRKKENGLIRLYFEDKKLTGTTVFPIEYKIDTINSVYNIGKKFIYYRGLDIKSEQVINIYSREDQRDVMSLSGSSYDNISAVGNFIYATGKRNVEELFEIINIKTNQYAKLSLQDSMSSRGMYY